MNPLASLLTSWTLNRAKSPLKQVGLILCCFLSLYLLSCSSSTEVIPTLLDDPKPVTPTVPSPTLLPPKAGTIRVASFGAASHNDVHQLSSEWATLFGPALAYSRLLKFKDSKATDIQVECDLCSSWGWAGALSLDFEINPLAKWQDKEGFASRAVSAQDVAFSLERLRTHGFPHSSLLDNVDEIIITSDSTLSITLHYPDADLPQRLASPYAVIMAPQAIGADVLVEFPTGSGPWKWTQGSTGQVNLEAWPLHHRAGVPAVERIEMIPISNLETGAALLDLGLVDIAQIEPDKAAEINNETINFIEVPRQGMGSILIFNQKRAPFNDIDVRRSVLQAIDPWAAIDATFTIGKVGIGIPLPNRSWRMADDQFRSYFVGSSSAKVIKDNDKSITLTIGNFGENHVEMGGILLDQLTQNGFNAELQVLGRREYFEQVWQENDFDVFVGPLPPSHTINGFLNGLVHSDGEQNISGYKNATIDSLLEDQAEEIDELVRKQLLQEIQKIIMDDAVFFMPLITSEMWAYGPRVENFKPMMPFGSGDFWSTVTLAESP